MSSSSNAPTEENTNMSSSANITPQIHYELLPQSALLPEENLSLPDTIRLLTEEGTKAFKLKDYETAVLKYEEASQLAELHYGNSEEFADALFNYGKALIENSIFQTSVLGDNSLEKRIALEIQEDELQHNNSHIYFEGEPSFEDEMVEELTEESLEKEINNNDGESHAETTNESQTDQDSDLNVANDVLIIARDIYLDVGTERSKASLGEVFMKLGDISLEQENFDQAVVDYREAVKVKSERLSDDNMELTEAYPFTSRFHYTDKSQIDQAIEHVERAMEVLNKCKKNLLEKLASVQETYGKGKQVAKSDDNTEDIEKKLNEIDQFLIEMEAKIEELNTAKINRDKEVPTPSEIALAEYVKMLTPSAESGSTTNAGSSSITSNVPINDITSLIKRKVVEDIKSIDENLTNTTTNENSVTNTMMDEGEEKKRKVENLIDETTSEGSGEGRSGENDESSPNKKVRLSG
ncbi:hypothetical protein RhiirA5_496940 [Rhizophagus irregularis]|uniref:Tetratricopeptide SHNi-TPR domain-containing protein n=2 Tax=Rhizophagus irregularis TaxID=588596 RepID=A0A2I1DVE3_9GLOM|nr:hypothetical protein GLOIN_2v1775443 [Rhizophagus irregularis DAOM 181602=DAOM 197198]PKC12440.1 hypothetical protein RhiirA5_496940 [Rhizophagus irregularis]PKC71510.1 hypothetical protein RhiirA1_531934 [Rhizophagus irregularis]PKK70409.1 hypothetical protein RhiirC2_849951 [Rhizophagus irregularis]PKY13835.1 hypothetical protein RhiirB3_425722 [Rhizophagus irregularis]POG70860.1 hypothetical protein GLOIN_2v1775443 [Rhizophagus irregularis DAOM 181602=DAOM 197198]|eukprot:XP_025177726.1 hypothetical protein GLOIN_2v1775443 [Rhizophagus irregularis DAOM 181602=DAOM 197198]